MVGGEQYVWLGSDCVQTVSTPIHELMHAIGFDHEQSRNDRDQYVEIHLENLMYPGK